MERLQKRIASSGVASRRKAEELIKEGRVKVNGVVVTELGVKVTTKDDVEVDGVLLSKQAHVYLALNKPRSIISSVSDEVGRKTVINLLPEEFLGKGIYPVGRLDYDTKGIILLTNDGDFMNMMTGPSSGVQKEYLVRIKGIINQTTVKKLEAGVVINNKKTLPCLIEIEDIDKKAESSLVRITLTQGMNHQVKEMFKSVGHDVKRLTRIRFGNISLGDLKEGEIRKLTVHEVKTLIELSKASKILKRENIRKYRLYN